MLPADPPSYESRINCAKLLVEVGQYDVSIILCIYYCLSICIFTCTVISIREPSRCLMDLFVKMMRF